MAVFRYWLRKRGTRAMPSRADIDPTELDPQVLPHLILTEVVETPARRRFRFRLSGTGLKDAVGLDLTGKFIDELNPNKSYADYIEGLYNIGIATRWPVFSTSVAVGARIDVYRTTRRLMCPLSRDGARVDMFLTGQTFQTIGENEVPTMTYAEDFRPGATEVIDPSLHSPSE
jgi:hypothetical protein